MKSYSDDVYDDEDDEDYEQQLLNVNLSASKIMPLTLINGNENINPSIINEQHDL